MFVVKELKPFQRELQRALSPADLVDVTLSYLLEQLTDEGRPVLPIFLDILRAEYEQGDGLYNELEKLRQAVDEALNQPESRPISQTRRPYDRLTSSQRNASPSRASQVKVEIKSSAPLSSPGTTEAQPDHKTDSRSPLQPPPTVPRPVDEASEEFNVAIEEKTFEGLALDYIESMMPVPRDTPHFHIASCLVSNILFYCFVHANDYWHPRIGKCKVEGKVDEPYLRRWTDEGQPRAEELHLPVTNVSFRAAEAFANWLSGLTAHQIRLPTLEEWHIAVNAGRINWLDEEIRLGHVNYHGTSGIMRRVDDFSPNPFGIRDLLGNAYDMCVTQSGPERRLLLIGGCYHSTKSQLRKQIALVSDTVCYEDASFRCVIVPTIEVT
jgi:formylglycine-generating enzyme required for sulfatase activity